MAPQYVTEQAGFHKLPSSCFLSKETVDHLSPPAVAHRNSGIKTSALVLCMTESIMVNSAGYNIERMFDSSYKLVFIFSISSKCGRKGRTQAPQEFYIKSPVSLFGGVSCTSRSVLYFSVEAVTYDDYASSETAPDNTGHKPTLLVLGTLHASCVLVYQLSHSTSRAVSL